MSNRFLEAKEIYAREGIDVEKALEAVKKIPVSIHCWQGDDVLGFDGSGSLEGGIQTTGNYPGRARTPEELMADLAYAAKMMPGTKRLNLHASYAFLGEDKGKIDRDQYTYKHFKPWVDFAKKSGFAGIDFNPTFFAHPRVKDNLTLSSPDEETRKFWVAHGRASLAIAAELGKAMGSPCFVNIWIPDGYKDIPSDRLGPRLRLKKSLDEMLEGYDKEWVIPAVESKVFGIGLESFTVGSSEFYQNYAARAGILCLMDMGHYHPTEVVSEKISALLPFYPKLALHVSRPVRWDSDHVVILNDELKELAKEIVRNDAAERVIIGLDFFDASINRISAWVTGQRSMEKALLYAFLQPNEKAKKLQDEADFTALMVLQEHAKLLPFGDIWDEFLAREGLKEDYLPEILGYEKEVLSRRK